MHDEQIHALRGAYEREKAARAAIARAEGELAYFRSLWGLFQRMIPLWPFVVGISLGSIGQLLIELGVPITVVKPMASPCIFVSFLGPIVLSLVRHSQSKSWVRPAALPPPTVRCASCGEEFEVTTSLHCVRCGSAPSSEVAARLVTETEARARLAEMTQAGVERSLEVARERNSTRWFTNLFRPTVTLSDAAEIGPLRDQLAAFARAKGARVIADDPSAWNDWLQKNWPTPMTPSITSMYRWAVHFDYRGHAAMLIAGYSPWTGEGILPDYWRRPVALYVAAPGPATRRLASDDQARAIQSGMILQLDGSGVVGYVSDAPPEWFSPESVDRQCGMCLQAVARADAEAVAAGVGHVSS
jgi:hypothetical protein